MSLCIVDSFKLLEPFKDSIIFILKINDPNINF